jgi:hypothetical protein
LSSIPASLCDSPRTIAHRLAGIHFGVGAGGLRPIANLQTDESQKQKSVPSHGTAVPLMRERRNS